MKHLIHRRGGPWLSTTLLVLIVTGCGNAVTPSSGDDQPASVRKMPSSASASTSVAYAVNGTVSTAGGAPVKNVMVAVASLDEPKNPVPELAVLTDDQGRYVWPASLAPGRYRLSVTNTTGTGSTDVQVTAGGQASADIVLDG